ncbi:hypothetical protein EAE91_08810 [Photorhabdus noenieputensis]|uniref:hypothetical protein n=1 Tax=Photorhabdus noenieputensis TaxID=1208607 RepID=UPI001BD588F3|nr:hypothetical protein [Photorhabdus noenieputensis]MBS9437272.1 hypothetical protein [Photorhabdus noenieputensis]MCK3668584.1 hypothetical protein [Photorhabdus noenieputensis]
MPLANKSVFIGGPIQSAIYDGGFHEELRMTIQLAVKTVETLNGKVFSAHLTEKFGIDTPHYTPEMVSKRDFQWMQQCDYFMPILPVHQGEELLRTDGTHIELGWASALKRPVLLITQLPIVRGGSHLLKGLEHICNLSKLDIHDFRHNPRQIGEIFRNFAVE